MLCGSMDPQTFQAFASEWDGSDLCQENKTEFEDDTEDTCSACFTLPNSKPLSAKSFNRNGF